MTSEVWLLIYNWNKISGQITREVEQTTGKVFLFCYQTVLLCMTERSVTLDFPHLDENKLQRHPGRPLLSPTHSQRISPLNYYDIGWLLTPQIPQDWLGLQIKHCP